MRVLVTGATGFIGSALVTRLSSSDRFSARIAVRREVVGFPPQLERHLVGGLSPTTDYREALKGVDAVVHLAARVHVMRDRAVDPLVEFRHVNVEGTLALARQAAMAGVKRLVFLSSVKVNGEGTTPGHPYTEGDVPAPTDPYGLSKQEAEQGLRRVAADTGMEVAIIRPPLVYGPGVKANFLRMMQWVRKGIPLPFGSINNRRSLVAVGNLVDLVVLCLEHPGAANETFLVSDGEDLSTTQLLSRVARALGVPARLVPVPAGLLQGAAALLGQRDLAQRLCGTLQVDIGKARALLGWTPPISTDTALHEAARHFLNVRDP